jgi:hypothetical protein
MWPASGARRTRSWRRLMQGDTMDDADARIPVTLITGFLEHFRLGLTRLGIPFSREA